MVTFYETQTWRNKKSDSRVHPFYSDARYTQ